MPEKGFGPGSPKSRGGLYSKGHAAYQDSVAGEDVVKVLLAVITCLGQAQQRAWATNGEHCPGDDNIAEQ